MYYNRLMSKRLPEFVDPLRLAEAGQGLKGRVAVASMLRLTTMLGLTPQFPAQRDVDAELVFGVDGHGVLHVLGSLRAELGAVCQRCLQPMELPFQVDIALGMARTLDEAECLPGDYEPLMVVDGEPQSLAAIIEDELLLALPPVPMHRIGQCPAESDTLSGAAVAEDLPPEGKKRPFAGLAVAFGIPAADDPDTSSCVAQLQQLKKKS